MPRDGYRQQPKERGTVVPQKVICFRIITECIEFYCGGIVIVLITLNPIIHTLLFCLPVFLIGIRTIRRERA